MKKKSKKMNWSKDGLRWVLARIIPLLMVGGVTVLVLHPSIWIGFIWSGIHFLLVYAIASIICHVMFHKGIMDIVKFGFEPQLSIEEDEETEEEKAEA